MRGPQKIGVSWLPQSRLCALQPGNPKRLFVHRASEYMRDTAFWIENVIKRKLGPPCAGAEWFDVTVSEAILATIFAERYYFDVEVRQIKRARPVEAERIRLGLTKREVARLLGMTDGHFSTDYAAAMRGKPPPRDPGIIDRVADLLADFASGLRVPVNRAASRRSLTPAAGPRTTAVSTGSPMRVAVSAGGSQRRQ